MNEKLLNENKKIKERINLLNDELEERERQEVGLENESKQLKKKLSNIKTEKDKILKNKRKLFF